MKCEACGQEVYQPTIVCSPGRAPDGIKMLSPSWRGNVEGLSSKAIEELGAGFAQWCYSNAHSGFMEEFVRNWSKLLGKED